MYDKNHFPDPHSFNPKRFLDTNGKYKHDDHVIPFGVGKRYCLGQTLAEKEFFLFLVGILQKFDINSPPMQKLPSYHLDDNPAPNLVRSCPNYEMIFSGHPLIWQLNRRIKCQVNTDYGTEPNSWNQVVPFG